MVYVVHCTYAACPFIPRAFPNHFKDAPLSSTSRRELPATSQHSTTTHQKFIATLTPQQSQSEALVSILRPDGAETSIMRATHSSYSSTSLMSGETRTGFLETCWHTWEPRVLTLLLSPAINLERVLESEHFHRRVPEGYRKNGGQLLSYLRIQKTGVDYLLQRMEARRKVARGILLLETEWYKRYIVVIL